VCVIVWPACYIVCVAYYGVASVDRIDKIIGHFCKRAYKRDNILQKRPIIYCVCDGVAYYSVCVYVQ